jgi:hypothetical protein
MERNNDKLVFSGWVVVELAAGIANLLVPHCLDIDVISQGETPRTVAPQAGCSISAN